MLSRRLADAVDALPLRPGMRVLEIGCGPGAAAREVAHRVAPHGHVLAVDRSERAIEQVRRTSDELIATGLLSVRAVSCEELTLTPGELPYDLAFAIRVGAFDGRHPAAGDIARRRVAAMLKPGGKLFVDGGNPLRELPLQPPRTPGELE